MGAGKLVGDHLWATSPSLKHNRFPFGTVLQKYVKPQTNCLNNVFICQHLLSVDGSNFSRRRRSLSVNRFWTENDLVVLDPKLQDTQVWKCSRHSASSTRGGTDQQNETVLQVTFLHWIEIFPFQPVYRRVPSKSANSQIPQLCFCQSNKMHLFFLLSVKDIFCSFSTGIVKIFETLGFNMLSEKFQHGQSWSRLLQRLGHVDKQKKL